MNLPRVPIPTRVRCRLLFQPPRPLQDLIYSKLGITEYGQVKVEERKSILAKWFKDSKDPFQMNERCTVLYSMHWNVNTNW